jgi:hypothetical protein
MRKTDKTGSFKTMRDLLITVTLIAFIIVSTFIITIKGITAVGTLANTIKVQMDKTSIGYP